MISIVIAEGEKPQIVESGYCPKAQLANLKKYLSDNNCYFEIGHEGGDKVFVSYNKDKLLTPERRTRILEDFGVFQNQ